MRFSLIACAFALFPTAAWTISPTWNVDGNNIWNADANWTSPATFPNTAGDTANFLNVITGNRTVTLGIPITVGNINFDDNNNYLITALTLTMNNGGGTANITVTNANGNGAHTIASALVLTDNLSVSQTSTGNFTLSGLISGVGKSLTKTGPTTLILSNGSNSYSGATAISAGVLQYDTNGCIPTTSAVTVDGTLNINATMTPANALDVTLNATGTMSSIGGTAVEIKSLAGTGTLSLGAVGAMTFNVTPSVSETFPGAITGGIANSSSNPTINNRLTKLGTTALTLNSGASTYVSRTFIAEGTIIAQNGSALGASGVNSAVYVRSTGTVGTLQLEGSITLNKTLVLNGAGFGGNGALRNAVGDNIVSGGVTIGWTNGGEVASAATIQVDAGTSLTLNNVISNSVAGTNVTKSGTGQLNYTGAGANTLTGTTTITAGVLNLSKTAGVNALNGLATITGGTLFLTNADQILNTTTVTIAGGTFNMNGNAETIGQLVLTSGTLTQTGGLLTLSNAAATALSMGNGTVDTTIPGDIAFSSSGNVVFTGPNNTATIVGAVNLGIQGHVFNIDTSTTAVSMDIQGSITGTGGITKSTGTGLLQFSGSTANTYSGTTALNAGTLLLNKTASTTALAGNATINAGATLLLAASEQIANSSDITLNGGTFSLGTPVGFTETIGRLIFTSGTLIQNGATLSLNNTASTTLSMTSGTSVPGNIAFTSTGGLTFVAGAGTATIVGNVDLSSGTHTFDIGVGGAPAVDIQGVISGAGAITKSTGTGTAQFSGGSANTYTGLTTITAGQLSLSKTAGTTAIAGNIAINGGTLFLTNANQIADTSTVTLSSGTFNMNANVETIGRLTFTGGTFLQGGATLTLGGSPTSLTMGGVTINGPIALSGTGDVTFGAASTAAIFSPTSSLDLGSSTHTFSITNGSATPDMDVQCVISGTGGITKQGSGANQLRFSGTSANTYSGLTTVLTGTLLLDKNNPAGGVNALAGDASITGGTLLLGSPNQISNTATVTIAGGAFDIASFNETIDNLVFTSGTYNQTGGVLTLASNTAALTMRNTTLGGSIVLSGTGSVVFDNTNNGTATISGTLDLNGLTHSFDIANGTATNDMTVSGSIANGSVTKINTGQLQLSGSSPNTYAGLTTVSAGTLLLDKNNPAGGVNAFAGNASITGGTLLLGSPDQIPDAATVTIAGGALDIASFNETIDNLVFTSGTYNQTGGVLTLASNTTALTMRDTTLGGSIILSGTGSVVFDNTNNGTATLSGTLDLNGLAHNFDIANGAATNDMTVSGSITNGSMTKINTGQLQLSGSSPNTYTGLTTVSAGTLLLDKNNPAGGVNAFAGDASITGGTLLLGSPDQIPDTATVTIAGGAFDVASFNETIGNLVFTSGTYNQTGGVLTLASNTTALTMRDTTLGGSIVLSGTGSVVFDNTNNGTATISSTLDLNGLTHSFDIANGTATNDMTVSGVIANGSVTKINTGQLQLSGSSPNTYTGLTTVSAGTLLLDKNNPAGGVNAFAGNASITGGTLLLGSPSQIPNTATVTIAGGALDIASFNETIDNLVFTSGTYNQTGGVLTLASNTTALTMRDTTLGGSIILSGTGSVVFDNTNNGTATITGTLDLNGLAHNFDIANGTATNDMTVSGVIANGNVTKINTGQLQLSGSSPNTYTGLTTVSAGTLLLDKNNPAGGVNAFAGNANITGGTLLLGSPSQIPNTATVTIAGGALDIASFNETIDNLVFTSGTYNQTGGVLTLTNNTTALTMRNTTLGGSIVLSGTGEVVFDNTNNGTATISGTLDLNGLAHNFDIANGTATNDTTVSGVIANGSVTKINTGQLELSGGSPNTYTGLTTVSAGTLSLNKTAAVISIAGDVLINPGGTLQSNTSDQIADTSTVTIAGGAWALVGGASDDVIHQLIFTSGSFTQPGGATLGLASNVTALTMRDTTISGPLNLIGTGDVVFDNTNNGTATLGGAVSLNGLAHTFNIADGAASIDMLISGAVSGAGGSLTKTGAGLLLLTGPNTYSGGTTVSSGTLQGDTAGLQGNILNNANLVFDQIAAGTYAGNISGTGTLVKQGAQALTITGVNSVGGETSVSAGALYVNGTLGGAGALTINAGSTLGGTGTISKNTTVFGTLAAGNSIGTLHFVGAQTMAAGSTLEVELSPTAADLIDITGTYTIQSGTTVHILPDPGNYQAPFTYTIVQATGGVSGTFSAVTSALPLFSGAVTYTADDVLLHVLFVSFADIVKKGNAGQVAQCLDSFNPPIDSDLQLVMNDLRQLDDIEAIKDALNQMQPSQFTALAIAQENTILSMNNALFNRLETVAPCCQTLGAQGLYLWAAPMGAYTSQHTEQGQSGFKTKTPGLFVGLDTSLGDFYLGGGLGYARTDLHWKNHRGAAKIQSIDAAFYGSWRRCLGFIESSLIYGYNTYSTDRRIDFTGLSRIHRHARGYHNGFEGAMNCKGALTFALDETVVSPYVQFDYVYVHENSFQEHGARSLNLEVQSKNSDLLVSEAGLAVSHCFSFSGQTFVPFLQLSALRESRSLGKKERARFNSCFLDVKGFNPSRTLGSATVGLTLKQHRSTLSLFYKGRYEKEFQDNSLYFELCFKL